MNYKFNTQRFLLTKLGEEGVMYDTDNNEYLSLSETLLKLVEGVENNLSVTEICGQLQDEYNIEPSQCRQEVDEAVEILVKKHILQKTDTITG